MSDENQQSTEFHESKKSDETPFVNQLIDENTNLKQKILTLSAELRSLKTKPGSSEGFIEEIEALSNAIKSIRSQSDSLTIEAARRKISGTIELHVQEQHQNRDLPHLNFNPSSSETRISRLENSLLTETERAALNAQRERLKKSINENLKFTNIEEMVEDEFQKRRRQKLRRQLEEESFQRGAFVSNSNISCATSPSASTPINNSQSSPHNLHHQHHQSQTHLDISTISSVSSPLRNNNGDDNLIVSPIRVPRKPLPTDEEYKSMMNEEDRIAAARHDEMRLLQQLEEAARNESLESALKNRRDFSVPREREEQQQMIIANATPLRSALVQAQETAFRLLKRDLEDAEKEEGQVQDKSKNKLSEEEFRQRTRERLAALQDLEKHHHEMIMRGNIAAGAISI